MFVLHVRNPPPAAGVADAERENWFAARLHEFGLNAQAIQHMPFSLSGPLSAMEPVGKSLLIALESNADLTLAMQLLQSLPECIAAGTIVCHLKAINCDNRALGAALASRMGTCAYALKSTFIASDCI